MKNINKTLLPFILALLFILVPLSGCRNIFFPDDAEELDEKKSHLRVANYNGGVGEDWLNKVIARFEADYADFEFEPGSGKVGVQVIPEHSQDYQFTSKFHAMKHNINHIFFSEQVNVNELASMNLLLDISEIVKKNVPGENYSILSKMYDEHERGLKARDGNYYAVPHYSMSNGINYDIDVFEDKLLYIADDYDENDPNAFIFVDEKDQARSVGPDGKPNTADDGLPSNYREFEKLLQYMVESGVTPLTWAGSLPSYTNFMLNTLIYNKLGKEQTEMFLYYDSKGKTVPIITSFIGDTPVIEQKVVTPETGYLLKQHASIYEVLKFVESIWSKRTSYIAKPAYEGLSSHSNGSAQWDFISSSLDGSSALPIAMLVEGTYWINEAKDKNFFEVSKVPVEKRNFGFMPVPTGENNSIKDFISVDTYNSYAFINKSIEGNKNLVNLAELFLQYCYTDISLQEFTVTTNLPKAVKYNLTLAQEGMLTSYGQSLWDINKKGNVIHNIGDTQLFIKHQSTLGLNNFWLASNIRNIKLEYSYVIPAFKDGISAKEYFLGMGSVKEDWVKNFGAALGI